MSIDSKRFSELAAGIQAIVVTIALVVGGLWTLGTYLQDKPARDADLRAKTKALQSIAKLELQIPDIHLLPLRSAKDHIFLQGDVLIKNVGTGLASVDLGQRPICIYRVSFDDSGEPALQTVGAFELPLAQNGRISSFVIPEGVTKQTSFLAYVDSPGFYMARVLSNQGASEKRNAVSTGLLKPDDSLYWSATHYFLVTAADVSAHMRQAFHAGLVMTEEMLDPKAPKIQDEATCVAQKIIEPTEVTAAVDVHHR